MSEPRKNHLNIDGGQVKDDENVASYKPIPETDTEFRTSKSNISKSKEKVSEDGAEEKLLQKEDEAKIVTRVDMADAKYVVGDHRNGDAKIELDANKRQFSGLTKEELMKYADDPFWVNLRWFMFVLFWTAWLAMLAGAIAIIVRAPTCPRPAPRTWYEDGPHVDMLNTHHEDLVPEMLALKEANTKALIMDAPTYEILDSPSLLDEYKEFLKKTKIMGLKVIVDLIPNYVSDTHRWFQLSVNKTGNYTDYFVWRSPKYDKEGNKEPTNWLSLMNEPAWKYVESRNEYYLHQYKADQPDLNFRNPEVQAHFIQVLTSWIKAGVDGIRLSSSVRQLFVDQSFQDEKPAFVTGNSGGDVDKYTFWEHKMTSDQPELDGLIAKWAGVVYDLSGDTDPVMTIEEDQGRTELYNLRPNLANVIRPPFSSPIQVTEDVGKVVDKIKKRLENGHWPAIQLKAPSAEAAQELARFALLLPAAPVFTRDQINEDSQSASTELLSHLVDIREDASIAHGQHRLAPVTAVNASEPQLMACARWKSGHNGFVAVYNPTGEDLYANLTSIEELPEALTVHHVSHQVRLTTNYTNNYSVASDDLHVPAWSSVVLSFVPKPAVDP